MKGTLIAIGLLATASLALPAFARGGLHLLDPAWNPRQARKLILCAQASDCSISRSRSAVG